MNTITFKCETITPMFMAGADGMTPELRAPSIKGVLRFWWRAINGHLDIKALRKQEAAIFGGSGKEQGRSKVLIRINPESIKLFDRSKKNDLSGEIQVNKNPLNNDNAPNEFRGILYLLYSVTTLNKRPFTPENTPFHLILSSHDIEALVSAVKAFLFMTYFGALGARSRRGAGAFRVIEATSNCKNETDDLRKLLSLFDTRDISTKEDLKERIKDILSYLPSSLCDDYSVLRKENIYLFPPENDWKSALKKIADPFYRFREDKQIDYLRTPNFGFPILHRNRNVTVKARNSKNHKELIERRASPLIFKLIKTGENLYFPVIIRLNGKLVPDGFEIYARPQNKKQAQNESSKPDITIVEEFLNSILEKEGEVIRL